MLRVDVNYVEDELWDAHYELARAFTKIRGLINGPCKGDLNLGEISSDILTSMSDIIEAIVEVRKYEV